MKYFIKQENYEVWQIPSKEKPQAVVIATIQDGNNIVRQGIGAAQSDGKDEVKTQLLLDSAALGARMRALGSLMKAYGKPVLEPDAALPPSLPIGQNDNAYLGKPEDAPGSATFAQLEVLTDMANEQNQRLEDITQEHYGKTPEEISKKQADRLHKHIMSKKE